MKAITKTTHVVSVILLILFTSLAAVGCGDDGSSSSNNTSSNDTSSNNTSSNDTSSNNTSSDASCSEACSNAVGVCSQIGSQSDCESKCSQLSQSELNCIAGASSCAEIDACGDSSSGGSSNSNNTGGEGEIGWTCSIDEECNSQYCRRTGDAIEGECAQNDFGDQCDSADSCLYERCMVRDQNDVTGFCSSTCTTDNECPFGWSCEESGNSAAKFCFQN